MTGTFSTRARVSSDVIADRITSAPAAAATVYCKQSKRDDDVTRVAFARDNARSLRVSNKTTRLRPDYRKLVARDGG